MRKLLIITACLLLFPITVYAHPGQTDGSGGHYNRSTGEYHYHHGQPAHDHYDADEDGNLDCPYDFKDNTQRRESSKRDPASSKPADSQVSEPTEETIKQPVKKSFFDTFLWDILCVFIKIAMSWAVFIFIMRVLFAL